ncbi:hypothetical protein [Pseudomonas cremoricolorata]|uniref:Uncharacterized protein n=1 Tax=Pseudomonas cremoricolorata TaxID=157783 RepID=A0A089WVV6_9PSED|nr:hypothetical protein [Pseudomonas cremoricolorata]AIR91389.1 hypothetical protein LK03_19885 [Pseudomonas cremoricolorata]
MASYQFNPAKSFTAKLYWQEVPMPSEQWDFSRLHRIGGTLNGDAPWSSEGWLHAGPDDYTDHKAAGYVISRRKFATQFWFGCYETDGEYDFEIRAAGVDDDHPHWSYANRRLDISRNGYLGLYKAAEPVGHPAAQNATMLWRFDSLPVDQLVANSLYAQLQLYSLHGLRINRHYEDGFAYLNEQQGESGWVALKLIRMGVAHP